MLLLIFAPHLYTDQAVQQKGQWQGLGPTIKLPTVPIMVIFLFAWYKSQCFNESLLQLLKHPWQCYVYFSPTREIITFVEHLTLNVNVVKIQINLQNVKYKKEFTWNAIITCIIAQFLQYSILLLEKTYLVYQVGTIGSCQYYHIF